MEFIKKNKKVIVLAVTFIAGGSAAIGYDLPMPLINLLLAAVGVN